MSKHTLKYEYIKPTNVESEVPGKQEMREPKNGNVTDENNINTQEEKDNFVPVLTIKKEETAFTKGDHKLQQVLVTENVAEEDKSNTAQVINPLYSEDHSAVIPGAQLFRESPKHIKIGQDDEDKMEVLEKDQDERKPKTKIPRLKFKEAVEKIKQERKNSLQGQETVKHSTQGRRSSIPKLRRRRYSRSVSDDFNKENNLEANKINTIVHKPEEEFEKLYDEIVVDKPVEVKADKILPDKIENLDELETSFEEIIHAYDENNSQPAKEENNKSKIPLNKQRSLHKESIPKQVERRLSLKRKSFDDKEKQHLAQFTKSGTAEDISIITAHQLSKESQINTNDEVMETVEEDQPGTNANIVQSDDKKVDYPENSNSMPTSDEIMIHMIHSNDNKDDADSYKYTQSLDEVDNTIFKREGDSNLNDSSITATTKNKFKKLKQKTSILSKIAIFQGKKDPVDKVNYEDTTLNSKELQQPIDETENHIDIKNNCVKQNDNESKESHELKNKESVAITHSDVTSDGTIPVKSNNAGLTADLIDNKKEDTATTLTENGDYIEDKKSDDKNVEHEEVSEEKGKVQNRISRIDKTKLVPKKEIKMDIPKNRSVFNKISMFERQSTKEPLKAKEELFKNKGKVHKMKVIDINDVEHRKPKITDTVLKTQPLRRSLIEDDKSNSQNADADSEKTDLHKTTEEVSTNEVDQIQHIETSESETLQVTEIEQPLNNQSPEDGGKVESNISEKPTTPVKDNSTKVIKIENLDSKSLNSRSATIRGKVHQLLVRINSSEKTEVAKKEVINVRERPRKRSVSEKIALFERKLTPVKPENTERSTETNTEKNDYTENVYLPKALTEEEYKQRIEDLDKASEIYGKVEKMPYVQLRNGTNMPVLSVGTALLDPRLIQPIIKAAIDLGYRAIDTAFIYGNEKEIGEAIKAKIEDGTVTREELFIVNKLWNTFHRQDLVEKACRDSLAALGLDYFDLYLVHSPISFKEGRDAVPMIANVLQYSDNDYMSAWFGMEDLVKLGLVKSIGVSNFNSQQLARVAEKGRVKPVVNQVECHPYLTQQRLADACADRGIKLSCFGILGSKGTPDELKTNLLPVIDEPLVVVMAAGLNVTAAQLLVRYQIDSGHLAVVKASSAEHLWSNLKALDFQLNQTQLNALNSINKNKRTYTFRGMGDTHRNYPFTAPF